MQSGYEVEQVFVRSRGGRLELSFVLVAPSGALKHDTISFPTRDMEEAVSSGARHLAGRGDVDDVERVRLRIEEGADMRDDDKLRKLFVKTWLDARRVE